MTAVIETFRKVGVYGDIKHIIIQGSAAMATSSTIDLGSDASDGRGVAMNTILNTLLQDDAGADKTSTWAPSTGVITIGSITTGIHNLSVWGY